MNLWHKKMLACAIIGMLFGVMIGFGIGSAVTINWGVGKAMYFLKLKGVELDIEEDEIIWGVNKYKRVIDMNWP